MAESAARKEIGLSSLLGAEKSSKPDELKEVPINKLHIPPEYPIKNLSDTGKFFCALQTKERGIKGPLYVIPHPEGYEVFDGVRRLQGAIANDYSHIQVVIAHNESREQAVYDMCDHIVRYKEEPLRSELAHAYNEMLRIANRQGERTDLTFSAARKKLPHSIDGISESLGVKKSHIYTTVSLLKLIPPVLEQVDLKSIAVKGGENLTALTDEQQTWVAYVMEKDEIVPSTEQTAELKRLAQTGKLTEEIVDKVMNDYTEPVASKVTLQGNFLKKYPYFADKTATQIERVVDKALSEYFKTHSKATGNRSTPPPDRGDGAR